jgi:hypothetical protein
VSADLRTLTVRQLAEHVRAVETRTEIEAVEEELMRRQVACIPLDADRDGQP